MEKKTNICLYSYNSRGNSNEKLDFIDSLISLSGINIPIVCIQEHFLLRNNLGKLSKKFNKSSVISKPAFKDFSIQTKGRPKGGLAVILPKQLRKYVKIIECDSWRIQPFILVIKDVRFLIINCYFPTDPKNVHANNQELDDCIAQLSSIISTQNFHPLHLIGDFNYVVGRNSNHVRVIQEFMRINHLSSAWDDFEIDFTHSYVNENNVTYTNIMDHFLTLERSKTVITDAGVLHIPENMSDHEPIYMKIETEPLEHKQKIETENQAKKFMWKKATDDQKLDFNDVLFRKLLNRKIPDCVENCNDVNCKDSEHTEHLDNYVKELLTDISDSGHQTIPMTSGKSPSEHSTKTPGWKMYVEPFQDNAHFWHSIWVSCGKPINTEVHKIMKKTRNLHHYQIRRCRRIEEYIVNQKIIENWFEKDTDILEEVKKQRRHDDEEDITIDGVADENIPNRFAEVYQELFNREQDQAIIGDISLEIEANLRNANTEIDKINFRTIKEALGKIKSNKSDPVWDFSSDFLKEGPDILIYHLEVMIRSFLVHGHVSEILLLATLVPIVKDKLGDLCSSSNYRSIAISSIILKLLDWVIIIKYGHLFKTDDFQFGFQEQSSTSMCSWVVYETIDSYIRKGSKVYGALMDCTKAFDTVQHSKLFMKLLDAGVPSIIVRLMIFLYKKQTADVRWKSKYSFEFNIRNGVRQGAVLSPILFCLYMDNLFKLLRDSKNGCWIGEYYAGVFGYADDLLLICPSRSGLQNMLGIAERYANSHKISFSTNINPTKSKTKGIIFTNKETKADPEPVLLNGNPLPWAKSGKYH